MTSRALRPDVAQWTVEALGRLFATFAVAQGLNLLAGGRIRFMAPAFDVARELPGSPESWAFLLMLPGLLALVSSLRGYLQGVVVGHTIMAVWSLFFAVGFLIAAEPRLGGSATASTTGFWSYSAFGVAFICIATAYHQSKEYARAR